MSGWGPRVSRGCWGNIICQFVLLLLNAQWRSAPPVPCACLWPYSPGLLTSPMVTVQGFSECVCSRILNVFFNCFCYSFQHSCQELTVVPFVWPLVAPVTFRTLSSSFGLGWACPPGHPLFVLGRVFLSMPWEDWGCVAFSEGVGSVL